LRDKVQANLGRIAPRDRNVYSVVITREGG
jgi:hypothetical protein